MTAAWFVLLALLANGTAGAQQDELDDDEAPVEAPQSGDTELIETLRTHGLLDEWIQASQVSPQASLLRVTGGGRYQAQRRAFLDAVEAWADLTEPVRNRGTAHPCEYAPMFLPSTSDAGQAARNTNDAINTGQPPILTYEPSSEATTRVKAELVALGLTSGRPRRWYTATVLGIPGVRAFPQCVALPTNNACDEYPYFSSTTSGPGAHLAPAPTDKNSLEGSAYGAFAYNCPATNAEREPLIVVPLIDPVIWVPTFGICR